MKSKARAADREEHAMQHCCAGFMNPKPDTLTLVLLLAVKGMERSLPPAEGKVVG
jgi:hypothetical protein